MASVQPASPRKSHVGAARRTSSVESHPAEQASTLYALQPAHPLPTLDLSVSIKSRVLSRTALDTFDKLIRRYSRVIYFTYLIGTLGYPIFLVLELRASRWLSVIVTAASIPAIIVAPSYLRYNVASLLVASTYEVWFFTIVNTATFFVCGVALGDIRCIALLPPWLGIETNILVDANVRAVRRLLWSTLLAMSVLLLTIPLVAFGWVRGISNVVLWQYSTHQVTAYAVVLNGITTLSALLFRNIFRNREKLRRKPLGRKEAAEVTCVSYRCSLRFVSLSGGNDPVDLTPELLGADQDRADSLDSSHLQHMRYLPTVRVIDGGNTIVPMGLLLRINSLIGSKRVVWVLLRLSIFLTLAATPMDQYLRNTNAVGEPPVHAWPHFVALGVTSAFFAYSCAHCQRQLLRLIVTSFDFWFLETQTLIVHLAMCDFFEWSQRAVPLVTVAWIWIHWVFFADGLTPMAREILGIKVNMFAHVAGFCVGTSALVLYLMIFSEGSADIFDRVLYTKKFSNFEVEFRVSPMFYSSFLTVLVWELNFFWRVCTYGGSDLFLVDGTVVYTNYLRLRHSLKDRSQRPLDDKQLGMAPTNRTLPGE